jgi:hypothetical protein
MPKAKMRFHPNGGEATNAIVTNTYVPYEEQEATLNNLTKCSNATMDWDRRTWKISELFTKVGY